MPRRGLREEAQEPQERDLRAGKDEKKEKKAA
jgi:hypothetical protein